MPKKSVSDLLCAGRRVFIRADFNVPLDADRRITDDRRIQQCLPTIRHVINHRGRAILASHLGRPTGDRDADREFSLKPVAERLRELLETPVAFCDECVGPKADAAVAALKDGEVLLLENLRFHPEETIIDVAKKNPDKKLTAEQDARRDGFARGLARHADMYVNNAFGTCHRKHVSMYDVPALLPSGNRVLGFLVERELQYMGDALRAPQRPFVALLGGAKVSDKIGVIRSLLDVVDRILIGGAMTYTFWAARGQGVGRSLCERDKLDLARELIAQAGDKLVLPTDSVAAAELRAGVATRTIEGPLPDNLMGLDIGPQTVERFQTIVHGARTILWNGPVGAFETPPFDAGTFALARAIAAASGKGAISIVGGGDSAAAVEQSGLAEKFTHISTGGGASLEFLEKRKFATIDILDDA